jgi:SAM-dependent methyltransferase
LANDFVKAQLTDFGGRSLFTEGATTAQVRDYWNTRIHDLSITTHPIGTKGFFDELEEYRFDKLQYLPRVVDFGSYRGLRLLEVGCGVGTDLVRFAKGGALVTGIDLSERAVDLCRRNLAANGVSGDVQVMDGEQMTYSDDTFDVVYAHGVLQYSPNPNAMIGEIHRVLKLGGPAIVMVYNRYSWLNFMSKVMHVNLEHDDAPVFLTFSQPELRELLQPFSRCHIVAERFPVPSRLHRGWKALLYNRLFVPAFNLLPRRLIRPLGWHFIATAIK